MRAVASQYPDQCVLPLHNPEAEPTRTAQTALVQQDAPYRVGGFALGCAANFAVGLLRLKVDLQSLDQRAQGDDCEWHPRLPQDWQRFAQALAQAR